MNTGTDQKATLVNPERETDRVGVLCRQPLGRIFGLREREREREAHLGFPERLDANFN